MTVPRKWTDAESEYLKKQYGKIPLKKIAKKLGRTIVSLYNQSYKMQLGQPKFSHLWNEASIAKLKKLHAKEYTDNEIAEALQVSRYTVSNRRRRLGLRKNVGTERHREKVRKKTRETIKKKGLGSLADVRSLAFRQFAIDSGWPEYLRPREVQILNLLAHGTPLTRKQIAEGIGMKWVGTRKTFKSNAPGGSYMASLARYKK